MKKQKHSKKNTKKYLFIILTIIFICGLSYILYNLYSNYKSKKQTQEILDKIPVDETQITETKSERILQLEELQKENDEIVAWLEIPDTNINYPIIPLKIL